MDQPASLLNVGRRYKSRLLSWSESEERIVVRIREVSQADEGSSYAIALSILLAVARPPIHVPQKVGGSRSIELHQKLFNLLPRQERMKSQPLISLTLLKSNGNGAPAQTVTDFPDEVHEGEMLWVDAESPTTQELADLKSRFGLDDYAIEDVTHRNQRPKLEEYGKNVFAVIHVPDVRNHKSGIIELFVFFQKNWIITIHSDESELIHSVDSRIRARGLAPLTTAPTPDLFFYIFLDFAVDAYYPILDEVEERLEDLDKQAITTFRTRVKRMENVVSIITTIGGVRRKLMTLRRSLTPTRDMIGMVMRGAVPFVADSSLRASEMSTTILSSFWRRSTTTETELAMSETSTSACILPQQTTPSSCSRLSPRYSFHSPFSQEFTE